MENRILEKKIFDTLKVIGIPCNLLGYHYIKTGVMIMQEDPTIIHKLVKDFYPEIAKIHNTTSSRVERAIRHAIEKGFEYGGSNDTENIMGLSYSPSKGKPTNGEFIANLYEYLKYSED